MKEDMHVQAAGIPTQSEPTDYAVRQEQHTREYEKAWADAPESFKRSAEDAGIHAAPDKPHGAAIEFNDNFQSSSYTPNMATSLDTEVDRLIEELGIKNKDVIIGVEKALRAQMNTEVEKAKAQALTHVVAFMLGTDRSNMLASAHSLLHAIPRFAGSNGFGSLRDSARICHVSVEWIRKSRDRWCGVLGLPAPIETCKSQEARGKYLTESKENHWRKQVFLTDESLAKKKLAKKNAATQS